jgi:hypothetical protein
MLQKILGGASVLALTATLFAQTPAPQWSIITTTQIKPEYRTEYEAAQKEITAAYKKAGVPSRIVVQSIMGDLMEYTSIAPLKNYAELDGPSPLVKALGEAGSQKLLKKIGMYMNSIHRVSSLAIPDISIMGSSPDIGDYVAVSVWRLFPGKGADFTAYMKDDYVPAMRKAGLENFWLSRPIYGGNLEERITVRPLHKLAELDGGPLTIKALGAEKAQALAMKQAKIVESVSYTVHRIRPDLSLLPAPPPPSK